MSYSIQHDSKTSNVSEGIPHITLILISYNHERFVHDTLDSLFAQTVAPNRIIYFDDGSTDQTAKIVRKRLHSLPYVEELPNCHVHTGLMPKLREAHSRVEHGYVVPLSCDDTLSPRALQVHREGILRTGAEWSVGATQLTDAELRPTTLISPAGIEHYTRKQLFRALLQCSPWIPANGWCYSIELFRRVGGYENSPLVEDYSLGLRFARTTTPVISNEVIAYWRRFDTSFGALRTVDWRRDHARVALEQASFSPLLARKIASSHLFHAASASFHKGDYAAAALDTLGSIQCYPHPLTVLQRLVYIGRHLSRHAAPHIHLKRGNSLSLYSYSYSPLLSSSPYVIHIITKFVTAYPCCYCVCLSCFCSPCESKCQMVYRSHLRAKIRI